MKFLGQWFEKDGEGKNDNGRRAEAESNGCRGDDPPSKKYWRSLPHHSKSVLLNTWLALLNALIVLATAQVMAPGGKGWTRGCASLLLFTSPPRQRQPSRSEPVKRSGYF